VCAAIDRKREREVAEAGEVKSESELGCPLISVVIPARNAWRDLIACLESLQRQTFSRSSFEIVVVDDGSRDAPPDEIGDASIRLVRQEPRGAASARNRGVKESRGEVVVFIDADCVADENWLAQLCGPLLDEPALTGTVGVCRSDQRSIVPLFIQLEYDARYGRLGERERTDFLNTANSAFRRETLLRYPLNEEFGRLEDVELSFRLNRDGHQMVYIRDAQVYHRHPVRIGTLLRRKYDYSRYAFSLYRMYPEKAVSDSSTPQTRRLRIVVLGFALLLLPLALLRVEFLVASLALMVISMAFSVPLYRRAFQVSVPLGLVTPGFVFLGSLAFVAGTARGLVGRRLGGGSVKGAAESVST